MSEQQYLEQIEANRQRRAAARRAFDVETVLACTAEIGRLTAEVHRLRREQER